MNDWTDTNWTHSLGTERLQIVLECLRASRNLVAIQMRLEASADLNKRLDLFEGHTLGAPWWPTTDLERVALKTKESQ